MELSRQFSRVWRFLYLGGLSAGASQRLSIFPGKRIEATQVLFRHQGFYGGSGPRNYCQSAGITLLNPQVQKYVLKLEEDVNAGIFCSNPDFEKIVLRLAGQMSDMQELRVLAEQEDFKDVAARDIETLQKELKKFEEEFFHSILDPDPLDENDVVIEVAGVGGKEGLFASELFQMYQNFAAYKDLEFTKAAFDLTNLGGLRRGVALISGPGAYYHLKFEGGIHSAQWIPKNLGSFHTRRYMATVVVLPVPTDIQLVIKPSDLHLEADRSLILIGSSVGKNLNSIAVRLTHLPTGMAVKSDLELSRTQNFGLALKVLRAKIYEKELQSQTTKIAQESHVLRQGLVSAFEKIRIYNFVHGLVQDRRIGRLNGISVKGILKGESQLDVLITKLHECDKLERLDQLFLVGTASMK